MASVGVNVKYDTNFQDDEKKNPLIFMVNDMGEILADKTTLQNLMSQDKNSIISVERISENNEITRGTLTLIHDPLASPSVVNLSSGSSLSKSNSSSIGNILNLDDHCEKMLEEEDDPQKLWCICKEPHNNKLMINCDECKEWFHAECVKINEAEAKKMEKEGIEWKCPPCSKMIKDISNKVEKLRLTVKKKKNSSAYKIENFSNTINSEKKETVSKKKLIEKHCLSCKKKLNSRSANYCSETCMQAHSRTESNPPTLIKSNKITIKKESLKMNKEKVEKKPEEKTKASSPKKRGRKKKVLNDDDYKPDKKCLSNKNQAPNTAPNKMPDEEKRKIIRVNLGKTLLGRLEDSKEININQEEIMELAAQIETEMYKYFKDTGNKYTAKYRSLIFNIKDSKNLTLFRKIVDKSLSPLAVVQMSPEEMANQELAKWREQETKHQLEMIKKNEIDMMALAKSVVVKTHKGEVVIENNNSLEFIDSNDTIQPDDTELNDQEETLSNEKDQSTKLEEQNAFYDEEKQKKRDKEKRSKRSHKKSMHKSRKDEHDESIKEQQIQSSSLDDSIDSTNKHKKSKKNRHHSKEKRNHKHHHKSSKSYDKNKKKENYSSSIHVNLENHTEHKEDFENNAANSSISINQEFNQQLVEQNSFQIKSAWRGIIDWPNVGKFFVSAQSAKNNNNELVKKFPTNLNVTGELSFETVWKYFENLTQEKIFKISIIQLMPLNSEEEFLYTSFCNYLEEKKLLGVIDGVTFDIKDFYLMSSSNIKDLPPMLMQFSLESGLEIYDRNLLVCIVIPQLKKRAANPETPVIPEKIAKKEITSEKIYLTELDSNEELIFTHGSKNNIQLLSKTVSDPSNV